MFGDTGDDLLIGDKGADELTGGSGADTFRFLSAANSRQGEGNHDTIQDFRTNEDVIDIKRIDANALQGGNQSFNYIRGNEFTGTAGELRLEVRGSWTLVQGDLNGDAVTDFEIEILTGDHVLVSSDFIL